MKQPIRRFFQNSGVTDQVVKAALDALSQSRQWRSCFISYSHSDMDFATLLNGSLEDLGIPCHRDEQGIAQGERIFEKAASLIINSNRTLLCCSRVSLTRDWIRREAAVALEKEEKEGKTVLVPLDIDGCILNDPDRPDGPQLGHKFRDRLIGDFRGWQSPQGFRAALVKLTDMLRIDVGLTG